MMYEVKYVINEIEVSRKFEEFDQAIKYASVLNEFVEIKFNNTQLVGKFGVDSVENGLLPNGDCYNWKKRRR